MITWDTVLEEIIINCIQSQDFNVLEEIILICEEL